MGIAQRPTRHPVPDLSSANSRRRLADSAISEILSTPLWTARILPPSPPPGRTSMANDGGGTGRRGEIVLPVGRGGEGRLSAVGRTSTLVLGRTERDTEPCLDRPSRNPVVCEASCPKGGKVAPGRASSVEARSGLLWPLKYQSRGHTPRRLRPLRGRFGSEGGKRKPPVEAFEARRPGELRSNGSRNRRLGRWTLSHAYLLVPSG
jgi:hypothetical protein